CTLRIYAPMLSKTAYVPELALPGVGTQAVSTRAADAALFARALAADEDFTIFGTTRLDLGAVERQALFSAMIGTSTSDSIRFRRGTGGLMVIESVVGGSDETTPSNDMVFAAPATLRWA